ncbi:iron transporter [Candidatus Kaiserbacteria bacterium CG10_big_fil_rev_8_21_14_0_10_56_12]|uniref:Iron transporter n=1 Tax=Candidatus Kaiserbacteria bacterium CG10_big_fil_rev_8_21_14_0_10_56_12 TaxID=1974611 RepID=A0A2H0U911_9BACT|nr:MAG: iron transporter [Candidatus Kaiserbacteria bacterium CG10_big_fil_rev_8_21_14_0_10_56_12]
MSPQNLRGELKQYWSQLGPGLTTGAADDDPSGVVTYSAAGAKYGLQLIWVALFTYPFMAVVQEMCARIGLVTGQGLAANIRHHYSAKALYMVTILLFGANVLNIAADLGMMAASARLLWPWLSVELMVIVFAGASLALQILVSFGKFSAYLKYLTLVLLAYVAVALSVPLDWAEVVRHTVIPSITFSKDQIILLCAIFGTTISPYLFFWQTAQEVEEEILHGETSIAARKRVVSEDTIRVMRRDVWSGMGFSNFITFCIFAACAGTLYVHGGIDITSAEQAALALKPFGDFAYILFVVGIVGTGLIAVPVLAGSTAYAIAESFGWHYGLYRKIKQAVAFYTIIIAATALGMMANFLHLDPIKGLIYAAAVNGVVAPFILFFVVRLSGSRHIMGSYANHRFLAGIGWMTVVIMAISGAAAGLSFIA